jgi:peptide/nickel transport system substrate-binding protein
MENNPELEYTRYLLGGTALFMRMDNPDLPWYDKRVRYALALALNNQEIADELYGGHAEVLAYPILPYPAFGDIYTPLEEQSETVRELFGYNPDKAKQLLAEAGYPDGFQAKVLCTSTGVDTLSVIKAYWADIGVELQLDVRDVPVFTGIYFRMKQEEMIYGAPGMGSNQPSKFSNYFGPGYFNHSRMSDARVDEVIEAVDGLGWEIYTDFPKFSAIMKPIYPYILEQCWAIPLPGRYSYTFWWPWMKDYNGVGSLGYFNTASYLNYMWIDQDLKEEMGY